MKDSDLLILTGDDVSDLVKGKEDDIITVVQRAYEAHTRGESSLPFSTFLHFPDAPQNRIIGLPAYLGGEFNVAGMKWVASFPDNIKHGLERASAAMIINSVTTGQPKAILEGSIINAKRTAASAALAARTLQSEEKAIFAGIVGCGLIHFETIRFLVYTCPQITKFILFDVDRERMQLFREKCVPLIGPRDIVFADDLQVLLRNANLISLATTAARPYIMDLASYTEKATILHISLRDLAPEVILACDNVADDIDHVLREGTSVQLAEQKVGNREFLRCTLGDILIGRAFSRRDEKSTVIFNPFGLGILDVALASYIYQRALEQGRGTRVASFIPSPWYQRS